MRRTEGTENEWCSPSAIFSHLLIDNKENERYTTWKRTENYEYSPFTIFSNLIIWKDIILNVYNLKLTENEWYSTEQKMINIHIIIWYPLIIPLPYLLFQLGEKAESERYTAWKG